VLNAPCDMTIGFGRYGTRPQATSATCDKIKFGLIISWW